MLFGGEEALVEAVPEKGSGRWFFENRILTDVSVPREVYPIPGENRAAHFHSEVVMWGQIGNLSAGWRKPSFCKSRPEFVL
jgi:hypothetical protein